jgi:3-oxoacyl-[acyl-carrier-protein] synthase-3
MQRNPVILATGSYVPERVVTNAEVDALLGASTDQWLLDNVGIRERRWMAPEQTTSDLIVAAAEKALARAGVAAEQVDLIIVSTDTPDYLSPSTSVVVQHKLGAVPRRLLRCQLGVCGLGHGAGSGRPLSAHRAGTKYVLVAGGYGMSRFLDFTDKKTANLFADGAGVALLGVGEQPGFLASNLLAVGSFHDALGIYTGGAQSSLARRRAWRSSAGQRWNSSRNSPRASTPTTGRS